MIIGILFSLILSITLVALFSGLPLIGIGVLCFLSTLETLNFHLLGKTWNLMNTVLLLFLIAQSIRFLITLQYDKRWLTTCTILGLTVFFSSLFCLNPIHSFIQSFYWLLYVAAGYFVGAGFIHKNKSIPVLTPTFATSIGLSIVFSFFSYILTRGGETFQIQGGFLNKHYYSIFLLCLLPFILNFAKWTETPRKKTIHTIVFYLILLLVIMTGSFVGIILAVALLGLSFGYGLLEKKQITWFIPVAVLLLLHWIQSGIQFNRFLTTRLGTDYQDWIREGFVALSLMTRNPISGVGYGQMESYIQWAYSDIVLTPATINASIFTLLGETGLLGGLAFMGLFLVAFNALLSHPEANEEEYRLNRSAQVSCILLVTSVFFYEVHVHLFTWCWLGLLYGVFSSRRISGSTALPVGTKRPFLITPHSQFR